MQAPHCAYGRRQRVVVLHKGDINAQGGAGTLAVGFSEKTAMIAKPAWRQKVQAEQGRSDSIHRHLLSDRFAIEAGVPQEHGLVLPKYRWTLKPDLKTSN